MMTLVIILPSQIKFTVQTSLQLFSSLELRENVLKLQHRQTNGDEIFPLAS